VGNWRRNIITTVVQNTSSIAEDRDDDDGTSALGKHAKKRCPQVGELHARKMDDML
jgi:hypothetical protein